MAVYKRSYRPYEGRVSSARFRFLVLARYALEKLFESKRLTIFMVLCYAMPLVAGLIIYLHHNMGALEVIRVRPDALIPINSDFFFLILSGQGILAFAMAAYAGPGLIAPDLSNGALPLYLCRPITRAEYVLGKMAVLLILLSAITWVPAMLLFLYQSMLAGGAWLSANLWLGASILTGSLVWIVCLSLLAVAISAWVKWKLAASGVLFAIFLVAPGFSEAINQVLRTNWGHVINPGHLIGTIWLDLFRTQMRGSVWAMFSPGSTDRLPLWAAWTMLGLLCAGCVVLLNHRLQAREVVR